MAGKRLLRTILGGVLALGICGSALGSGLRTPVRWSTLHVDKGVTKAKDAHNREITVGFDPELQRQLSHLLEQAQPIAGAAVLVDAKTGQVLAAHEVGEEKEGSLLFTPIAPAASVFKIVTTAALYEHTTVTPTTRVCTKGGKREISEEHLVPASGPGTVCSPFAHALGVSRNAAYAQLATQKLLRSDLVKMAENLGFGAPLQMDAVGKLGALDVPYNDLEFARTAAGFENSRLSVFGGAQLALTIASGGLQMAMHLNQEASDAKPKRVLSPLTARRLRDAMEVTIHSGTAQESFVNAHGRSTVGPVQVAGKTGTLKPSRDAPTTNWFIGFAPSEEPRVVVSVLLQNPDKWVRKGHQLGRDLIQVYLKHLGVAGVP
jgi:peptidoglycan glycosyltransferase